MNDADSFRLISREYAGRALFFIFAMLVIFWPHRASATDKTEGFGTRADLLAGQCRYESSKPGIYWQNDDDHSNRYKTNGCMQFGVHAQLNPLFGVNFRYAPNLGTSHTRAFAYTCPNDDCSQLDKSLAARAECKDGIKNNCRYLWMGEGGARNIFTFSIDIEAFRVGKLAGTAGLGASAYRLTWHQQVSNDDCDATCPWRFNIEQRTGWFLSPMAELGLRYYLDPKVSIYAGTEYRMRTTQHTPATMGFGGKQQSWLAGISYSF